MIALRELVGDVHDAPRRTDQAPDLEHRQRATGANPTRGD